MCAHAWDATAASGARSDPERGERLSEPHHLLGERSEGPLIPHAVLAPEDRCDRVGRAFRPGMHAGLGDVQPGALEPGRPLDPARVVEDAVPRTGEIEVEVVRDGAPEATGLLDRHAVQCGVAVAAERTSEARHVRRLELGGAGRPGEFDVRVSDH